MFDCRKLSGSRWAGVLSVGVIMAGSLALAGCGSSSKAPQTSSKPSKTTPASTGTSGGVNKTTVLLLSVGQSSANPYGYSNLLGFKAAAQALGTEARSVELVPESQYASTLTSYAQKETGLIFAGGEEFEEAVYQVAPKYPESTFVCVTCTAAEGQPENVVNLRPNETQVNYLGGVAAGLATKSNKVGDVMGFSYPDLVESADGFEAGVKAVNPKAEVTNVVVGTFQDPSKVRAAAQALMGKGVDVIRHETNAAGAGLFDAVKGTKVWAVGSYLDQSSLAPNNVLTSTAPNLKAAYTEIAKDYEAGKFTKSTYELEFGNEGIVVTPINKKAPDAAHIQEVVNEDEEKIISGALKLPDKNLS